MKRKRWFRRVRNFEPDYEHRVWCNCRLCRRAFWSERYAPHRYPVKMSMLGVERPSGTFFGNG
jgi:hypothetical protein